MRTEPSLLEPVEPALEPSRALVRGISQGRFFAIAWRLGLVALAAVVDLCTPLGSGSGLVYPLVVLACIAADPLRFTWGVAALCSALALGRLGLPHAPAPDHIIGYRLMVTFVIWVIALVGFWQQRATRSQRLAEAEAAAALKANAALKEALTRTASAEAELRRGQRLLETVATMARIGGWEIELPSMTPIWSPEVYRIYEVDPSRPLDLAGSLEFYAPEARPVIEEALREAIVRGASFDHTVPVITATGQRRWVRHIGVAERSNEVTTRLSGALQDVTHQHETQVRLARASRSSSEGHWEYDFGTESVWCSAAYQELLGLPARDVRISVEEFRARVHPEDVLGVSVAFERHISEGAPYDVQVRMRRTSGEWRWFRTRGAVERDELGRLVSLAGSVIDIEADRQAQEELRRVRARYERAVHGTQDGLWEWDIPGRRIWMSPRYLELLGMSPEKPFPEDPEQLWALFHAEDLARVEAATKAHVSNGAPYDVEVRMRTQSGEYRWFRIRGTLERDSTGEAARLSGSAQDVTPQKLAEAARIEAEQRLGRAIRGSSDGFFEIVLAKDGTEERVWHSPRVREMLGYGPDEPFPAQLQQLMLAEDSERVEQAQKRHFADRAPFDVTFRLPTRGGETRWFRARGLCERDAEGRPTRFSGSIQDITTQREAEGALVAAKEAAAAANRAKSEFLANMSHEIRTPMNGVLGMTELLLDTRLEPVQREFAETLRSSATSLLGILNDILDFSKIEAGKLEIECVEMDVRECVEAVGTMMAVQAASKNLEFIVNVDPGIPDLVLGDPHRLRQILTNLAGNAVKFTHHGEIVVEVLAIGVQGGKALLHFEVRDSGAGMSAEVLNRLFQPFVQADASTTRHYGGTGLGLSIVKRLVELMGGNISVVSTPGEGSSFSFTLPCQLVEGSMSPVASGLFSPHGRRVLIVDDNQTNRRVLSGQLAPAGYEVEMAGSVEEALDRLRSPTDDGQTFDVVIADEQLPGSDGMTLAARIKSIPELAQTPLIMLTSLDRHGNVQRLSELGFSGYLTKPVRGRELRACIERVLENESNAASTTIPRLVTRGSLAADKAAAPRYRGRVLVVEDNPVNQQVTRRFLERLGCEVDVAENGQRAVEFCMRATYQLVLMDVQMPVMDGLTATREIRSHEEGGRRVPIIALTASAMTDELERCLEAGMDGLLTKPLEPTRLGETLERYGLAVDSGASVGLPSVPIVRASAPAVDLARLRSIVGDDEEFVLELCTTFLASSGRIVDELRRAYQAQDRALVGTMAHKLKGGSNSVCAQRVSDLAAALERASPSRSLAELGESIEQIAAALQECAGFIEAQVA